MKVRQIEVRVTSEVGVGKSTVAYLITQALREAGLEVNLHDFDDPAITPAKSLVVLQGIRDREAEGREKVVVEVVTKQAPRVGWKANTDTGIK